MSMPCPICKSSAKCLDSRQRDGFTYRRYKCDSDLKHRWTTVEIVAVDSSSGKSLNETAEELRARFGKDSYYLKTEALRVRLLDMLNVLERTEP